VAEWDEVQVVQILSLLFLKALMQLPSLIRFPLSMPHQLHWKLRARYFDLLSRKHANVKL
jgi:hypothetical protein